MWSPLSRLAFNFADLVLQKQVSWDNRYQKLGSDAPMCMTGNVHFRLHIHTGAMLGHMATKFERFISRQGSS